MGRDGHDRPGPVFHQDVIRHPDRNGLAGKRVDRRHPGVHALLVGLPDFALETGLGDGLGDPSPQFGLPRSPDQAVDERMFGGENQKSRPENRIESGGENTDGLSQGRDGEFQISPFAPADPVSLHGQDMLGPLAQLGVPGEEFLGIIGDLEDPLLHLFLLDRRGTPPAGAAGGLFVGQHGPAGRAPVDPTFATIGQAALVHLEEDPLVPFVVFGQAGVDLPRPIVGEAHPSELGFHMSDVVQGPLLGVNPVFDGRVLGRHAQSIPADGMEDVVSPHHLESGDDVADGIIADVAHMNPARRIGVHFQGVEFGPGGILGGGEGVLFVPHFLPAGFDGLKIVFAGGVVLAHDRSSFFPFPAENTFKRAENQAKV
jgi:hypothetical protein